MIVPVVDDICGNLLVGHSRTGIKGVSLGVEVGNKCIYSDKILQLCKLKHRANFFINAVK